MGRKTDNKEKPLTQRYPKAIREVIVYAIVNGELFLEEAMLKYGVEDRHLVISWLRKYLRKERKEDEISAKRKIVMKSPKELPGFDLLYTLAMERDFLFFKKFEEVFPNFCNTLKLRYPTILLSELKFLAYIRLGLTSKEIAVATSVTPGAIDRLKIRVRRKFGVPFKKKMDDWLLTVLEG